MCIRSYQPNCPPPKFVFSGKREEERCGRALDSIVCAGSIISGGLVEHSIISFGARVNSYAHVEDSILLQGVDIGRRARVRRAIIEKGVRIAPEAEVGFDHELDRSRGLVVTDSGIVIVAKGTDVRAMRKQATLVD